MHFRSWGLAACLCVLVLFGLLAFSQLVSPGTTADAAPPPTATPTVKPRNPADATPTGGSWTRLNPPPTDSNLNSVFSLDGQTAWAVGDDGAIIKTADGGTNWTAVSSGITNTLRSVKFADVQNGWAAGDNGTIINTSDGGGSWTAQATGTTNPLYSIDFVDSRNGWAVGSNGTVLKTNHGGQVWASQTVSPTADLTAVDFADDRTGWVVGSGGAVYKTADGGSTWAQQALSTTMRLASVSFVNGQVGWAVEGGSFYGFNTVWKTTDGGSNWGAVKSFESTYVGTLSSVYFQDTQTGWAVGPYSRLLSTTNGGTSWMGIPTNWGTTYGSYRSVHFANAQTGWIVGEGGLIIKSTDGGRTWQEQNRVLNMDLGSVHFIDAQTGWAQASVPVDVDRSQRVVVKTTDGGATWSVQSGVNGWLSSLDAFSAQSLWALSTEDGVIHSSDGGATWAPRSTTITPTLGSMDFVDDRTGWVVGGGAIYKTADGGATWTPQTYDAPKPHFYSIGAVRGSDFWAVGEMGNMAWLPAGDVAWYRTGHRSAVAPYTLYSTASDWFWGGASYAAKTWAVGANGTILWAWQGPVNVPTYPSWPSWGLQTSGVTETLYSVAVSADDANPKGSDWTKVVGWAVGEKGTILSSGNGLTWTVRTSGTAETLYSVAASFYTDTYRVWAVGGNGVILNSADSGTTWTPRTSGVSQTLRSVFTLGYGHPVTLWAVGDRGIILKSTNDGISWTAQASGTTEDLRSVAFYDLLTGWAVGTKGTILKTTDGGATWSPQASGTANDLESVAICSNAGYTGDCPAGPTAVMVAGAGATLLRSSDGGATWSALRYAANDSVTSVQFLDAQHGWAWGSYPADLFLRTADGGATWSAAYSGASGLLWIDFADANNGWAVGPSAGVGTILRTTDGGASWLPQTSPVTGTYLSSLTAVDAQTAWAAGSTYDGTRMIGIILYTSDGGANWTRQSTDTYTDGFWVFSLDGRTAWAVGGRSAVLRYVASLPARAYMPGVSKNHSAGW